MAEAREWRLKARTPIWTGRVTRIEERRGKKGKELREVIDSDRLITTGLLGSIRWWFEVLVRGLGGRACDPNSTNCQDRQHCVVCELFGCTGWARKFRFQVLDVTEGEQLRSKRIQRGDLFRLRFVPLREIAREEWALVDLTLRLIADYGAIGGKTVLKPSDEDPQKDAPHHHDYGLLSVEKSPSLTEISRNDLEAYVRNGEWRLVQLDDFAWASLEHFWCVNGKYLARRNPQTSNFNRVIGRPEPKHQAGNGDSWLAGNRPRRNVEAESKKVFSFKNPPRTFGFVKPGTVSFDDIKERLRQAWPDLGDDEFLTSNEILKSLWSDGAGTS